MRHQILVLLGVICLTGGCKKQEPEPLKPTLLSIQVIYQQTRLPVDSAHIVVSGTKGSYLTGREIQTFLDAYTDQKGRLQASMMIPRDYYTVFNCGKNVKIGNRLKLYSLSYIQPYTDKLKLEQENIIEAQLDTLK